MCKCVETWAQYAAARKALDRAIGMFEIANPERETKHYGAMWALYVVARNACSNPGQHPHRNQ